jgi:hypothetical protein
LLVQILQTACAQHLVRDDGIQNRLLLPRMKIQPASCTTAGIDHVLAKPPVQ